MKKKSVLSLREETEKEAAKIEKEIAGNPQLDQIQVSDEMEKRLAKQIEDYEKKHGHGRKVEYRRKSIFRKRALVAAAVLMVALVATSVTAVGSKSYLKEIIEKFTGDDEQASVINVEDMETQPSDSADETQIYRKIEDKLGIQVVRMRYKPKGMRLQRYTLDKNQRRAQLFYEYEDEIVSYSIYVNNEDSSFGQKETDEVLDEFVIENNNRKIQVTEYKVENYKLHGLLAEFEDYGMHYQIRGTMNRTEFEKILKNLEFY